MAANKKFTPRASSNLIEGGVTENINTDVVITPEEGATTEDVVAPEKDVEETKTPEDATATSGEVEPEETTPDDTLEEGKKTDEVTFTAETEKKPIERKVKIRLAKKYDGCIGGTWYHFEKDQVVSVPENVKRILNSEEGMLKPL